MSELSSEPSSLGEECFYCQREVTDQFHYCRIFGGKTYVCSNCINNERRCRCGDPIRAHEVRSEYEVVLRAVQTLQRRQIALERMVAALERPAEVDQLPEEHHPAAEEQPIGTEPMPEPPTYDRLRYLKHPIQRRHMGEWKIYQFHPEDEVQMKAKSKVPPGCRDLEIGGEVVWTLDAGPELDSPCYYLVNDEKRLLFRAGTKSGRHRLAKFVLGFFNVPWRCREAFMEGEWLGTRVRL